MFTSRAHKARFKDRLILKLLKIPLLQICSFDCTNTCSCSNIHCHLSLCLLWSQWFSQAYAARVLVCWSHVAWYILRTHDATCHIALSKINPQSVCQPPPPQCPGHRGDGPLSPPKHSCGWATGAVPAGRDMTAEEELPHSDINGGLLTQGRCVSGCMRLVLCLSQFASTEIVCLKWLWFYNAIFFFNVQWNQSDTRSNYLSRICIYDVRNRNDDGNRFVHSVRQARRHCAYIYIQRPLRRAVPKNRNITHRTTDKTDV